MREPLTKQEKHAALWIRACKSNRTNNKRFYALVKRFCYLNINPEKNPEYQTLYHFLYEAIKLFYPDVDKDMQKIISSAFREEEMNNFYNDLKKENKQPTFGRLLFEALALYVALTQPDKYVLEYPAPLLFENMDARYERKRIEREKQLKQEEKWLRQDESVADSLEGK